MEHKCDSLWKPLLDLGFEWPCERQYGHTRSWHQHTDEKGRRTQWEWTEQEREKVKATK